MMDAVEMGSPAGERRPEVPWQVRWLPVDALRIDEEYQRRLQPAIVRRLAARYNPDLAAGLRVSERRDGSYWIKDGQHRLEALKLLGYRSAYCYVERGDQVDEARAFVPLNAGSKASSLARFKAAREARDDEDVLAVDRIIVGRGFEIDYSGFASAPTAFWAVTTALRLYRARGGDVPGPERLARALELARQTWPDKRGAGQSVIIGALDRFYARYGPQGFSRRDFVRKCGLLQPDEVVLKAQRQAHALGHAAELWAVQELVKAYNHGLHNPDRRLDWPIAVGGRGRSLSAADEDEPDAMEEEEEDAP